MFCMKNEKIWSFCSFVPTIVAPTRNYVVCSQWVIKNFRKPVSQTFENISYFRNNRHQLVLIHLPRLQIPSARFANAIVPLCNYTQLEKTKFFSEVFQKMSTNFTIKFKHISGTLRFRKPLTYLVSLVRNTVFLWLLTVTQRRFATLPQLVWHTVNESYREWVGHSLNLNL